MTKRFLALVLALVMLLGVVGLTACSGKNDETSGEETEEETTIIYSEGLDFSLNEDSASYSVSGIGTCTENDIKIPPLYNNMPVTSISYSAFVNCTGLTTITIPDSVTSIRYSAFANCTGLTSINFQGTKAQWEAIEKRSFWDSSTGNYVIHCTDGDISIE